MPVPVSLVGGCVATRFLGCPDDVRLEGYFYGDLSPWERFIIRLHISTCAKCRARVAEYQEFDAALKAVPIEEPPSGFEDDLIRMVKAWDFDPDPPPPIMAEDQGHESVPITLGYKIRWAAGSLVFLIGSFLQYRYGALLPKVFGGGTNLLSSLQDIGFLWDYMVSGAWWNGLVSIIAAIKTDGFASLEILRTALPSQALSVIVFGGITVVVLFNQHKASKDRGEGTE